MSLACFKILGAHEPAQAVLDRRIIVEDVVDEIICAAPDRNSFDSFLHRGTTRAGIAAHARTMQADALVDRRRRVTR